MIQFIPPAVLFIILAVSGVAHASCDNPPGEAGYQVYNSTHNVMQYCDGDKWIGMGGGGGGEGLSLDCDPGQVVGSDGDDFVCASSAVFSGTVQAAAPTATGHLATKGYVDAAVASAGGGGGGASCYYVLNPAACGSGFVAMPGNMAFYSGGQASICCSTGGSSGDTAPDAFDFPDTPELAHSVTHTWTATQITGFDSANVILDGYPGMEYRTCADSGCSNVLKNWKSTPDIISGGQYLQLRLTATHGTRAVVTIAIGDMSDTIAIKKPWAVFVTSGTWAGSLGGLAGANAKCQSAANAAGLRGTYRAWITDGVGSNAPAVLFENKSTTVPFVLPGGVKVADNWADLVDSTLDATINRNENGGSVSSGEEVWTNTTAGGTLWNSDSDYHCNNWSSSGASRKGAFGRVGQTTSSWSTLSRVECNELKRLYCFQTQAN